MNVKKNTQHVPTQIKNPELVEKRRRQIIDAAVKLFIEKGFHKTTTREIAGAAGFSIGSLYEYVTSKEDILYLVCEAIHHEVESGVAKALENSAGGRDALARVIREFILVCHKWRGHILMMYQDTQSLPERWQRQVLENEVGITNLFAEVIGRLIDNGDLPEMEERYINLVAHNISVIGHMWTFRSWYLSRFYSIEDFIKLQTEFILGFSR
jgi:TetR/AcrR family transcriptional regulator, cholesterol catabolism regulator